MSSPCDLVDCPNCDGTFYVNDLVCSFCGKDTGNRDLMFCDHCNKEIAGTYSELKAHEESHEKKKKTVNKKDIEFIRGNNIGKTYRSSRT